MTIPVALVGYGYGGRTFHAPLIASVPGLQLACIVTSRPDAAVRDWPGAGVLSLDDALRDRAVALVVIATPTGTHAALARRALEAGKHLVVDKPLAASSSEARGLVTLAESVGVTASVFHNRRWDADFLTVRDLLRRQALGRIVQVRSHFDRYRPTVRDRWRERTGPGAGTWQDLGPHLVDQAVQLFGRPESLVADLAIDRAGGETVDYFHVRLRYPSCRVVLESSSLEMTAAPLRFLVQGESGTYMKNGFDPQEDALRRGTRPGAPEWGADRLPGTILRREHDQLVEESVAGERGNYSAFYTGVRDAILGKAPLPVTLREAAAVVELLECAERSAALRCAVACGDPP